jgi:hypothetical protein
VTRGNPPEPLTGDAHTRLHGANWPRRALGDADLRDVVETSMRACRSEEHIGELDVAQRSRRKAGHFSVQRGADPRHLRLRDPGPPAPRAATKSSTLRVDTPTRTPPSPPRTMPDRSTAPESTGRSCPPQLGNRQPDVTSLGGQQTGPVCRSASSTGPGHADNARRRSPRSPRHRSTPAAPARHPCGSIDIATGTDRVKQLGPVKLREGHRKPPFSRTWSFSRRSPGGPTQRWTPASTPLSRTSTHRCGRHSAAALPAGDSSAIGQRRARAASDFACCLAARWRQACLPRGHLTGVRIPLHA